MKGTPLVDKAKQSYDKEQDNPSLNMSEGDSEDPVRSLSDKVTKKKKKEKKRKRQSVDEEKLVAVDNNSSFKKESKDKKETESEKKDGPKSSMDGGNPGETGVVDKDARRQERKREREARHRQKEALMEKVPKVDEHGITYTKLQIKRMLKRVKQGLNPVPTEEEERQRLRNEAQLRREEEEELAGLVFKRDDQRDEAEDEDGNGSEEESGDDNAESDADEADVDASATGEAEIDSQQIGLEPPKKKAKRSKAVPPDYTCMACNNKHTPVHWIYDCPDKKTVKGINNKRKKERGIHEPDSRKVFVSGLPFEIKVSDVQQLFVGCGEVSSCKLLKFNDTGRCNGQAYVSFKTDEAASKAIKLSGTVVNNTVDDSKKKKKAKDSPASKRLELKLKISRVLNRRKTKKN